MNAALNLMHAEPYHPQYKRKNSEKTHPNCPADHTLRLSLISSCASQNLPTIQPSSHPTNNLPKEIDMQIYMEQKLQTTRDAIYFKHLKCNQRLNNLLTNLKG